MATTTNNLSTHPYDEPWNIVKDLRAQIHDLRAAFSAEQKQRAAEVMELRNELAVLKEALDKEKHERQVQCHTLTNDLQVTNSEWKSAVEEMKPHYRQQIEKLNQLLQDEIRDRKAAESLRETRENTMNSNLESHKTVFQTTVSHIKQDNQSTKDEHATRINALLHDLGVVVDFLLNSSNSYDVLKSMALRSNDKSAPRGSMARSTSCRASFRL